MAYGLKYRLTQALRDGTSLVANIYEKDYTEEDVIDYEAVRIQLNSNASGDEPLAAIVSSQLNISFIVSDSNSTNFPDLLNFDVRKYFVKLENNNDLFWCGFLFNDYVQVPFTTGYVQVDIIAIDGLSFLNDTPFNYYELKSINERERLIDIIAETLNVIAFPEPITLWTACSYYAEGMFDRSDASGDEPFIQTYQYRRDFQGFTYYEVLTKILESFGCRLFQSDGKWQLLAINEMCDTTRYYTEYAIYPSVSVANSGTFNKNVTIEPYASGNVHFINNSQVKIVRKGYPKLNLKHTYQFPDNYAHNGNFKGIVSTNVLYGWILDKTGTGTAQIIENSEDESNTILLRESGGSASLEMGTLLAPLAYLPYMVSPSFTISFAYKMIFTKAKMQVTLRENLSSTVYYYNSSNQWQTTATFIDITANRAARWETYNNEIYLNNVPNGYIKVKIYVDSLTYSGIDINTFKITQNQTVEKGVNIIRQVGDTKVPTKELEQPYGNFYNIDGSNNIGVLYDSSGSILKNWYRYPNSESFYYLQQLIARQYSNLLNKNFATLEGDLGSFETIKGLNYLDKVYTITDPSTTPLSYNGKKFLMNRATIIPQVDESDSIQIIEITNVDNDSTETIEHINS
jgi:hypothetical protein